MRYPQRPVVLLLGIAALAGVIPRAPAERMGRITLDPKTYKSPSGEYELRVDPSTIYGQGKGTYRMTRTGTEVWAGEMPITLWEALVADDGTVAGYAYSLGMENYPSRKDQETEGRLHLMILDPSGTVRMNEVLPRRGIFSCTSTVDRNVTGILLDPENDRFIVRCTEGGWSSDGEVWRIFKLTTGQLQDEFQFAHPEAGTHEFWCILATRPVAGTPLILVNWSYTKWAEDGNTQRAEGGSFALIDAAGAPVWELDRPNDYPEDFVYSSRQAGEGAILRTATPRRFELRFVKENQRVTFEVEPDGEGRWRVTERGRSDFGAAASQEPEDQPAKLDSLTPRHLGTITLETDSAPAPEIRDIANFDVDDQGRIGFLRRERDHSTTFVLVDAAGRVIRAVSLKETFGPAYNLPTATSTAGDRWLLTARTWQSAPGGNEHVTTRAWWLNTATAAIEEIQPFTGQGARHVAATRDGGFVVTISPESSAGQRDELVAFDREGKERWRAAPDDVILGVTVTTNGRIIAQHGYGERTLSVTTPDGKVLETRDCRDLFGEERGCVEFIGADANGGLAVVFSAQAPRLWRTQRDWQVTSRLEPHFPDGRIVDLASGSDEAALRAASDGTLWVCDGHALLRLDSDGVVSQVLGEAPDTPALRHIALVTMDQQGNLYAVEERSGDTHVFGPNGQRTRLLRPNPTDFTESWRMSEITVAGDGSVVLGGLEFSPAGDRIGFRTAPAEIEALSRFDGRRLFHPHSRKCWITSSEAAVLLDEDNQVLRTVARHPDGRWLDHIEIAAVGPDGSLAVTTRTTRAGTDEKKTVSVFTATGEPRASAPLPNLPDVWPISEQLAFNGRLVLTGPWGFEDAHYVAVDFGVSPPHWYDLGDFRPYEDVWHYGFVKDGQELWLFAEAARKIERFEVPLPPATADAKAP